MQLQTTLEAFDDVVRLRRAWKMGQPPDAPATDLKVVLDRHLEAQGATLRRKAALAAIVTLVIKFGEDEDPSEEDKGRLRDEAVAWVATWVGSAPLAQRVGPIEARHVPGAGRKAGHVPRGIAIEIVVAPVRVHRHRGSSARRVAVSMALNELTQATLGPGSPTRHAEALAASWRSHLAKALPDLAIAERAPTARELATEVRTLQEIVANVEDMRERNEALDAALADHEAKVERLRAFPEQVEAALAAIEKGVMFLKESGNIGLRQGHQWEPSVATHVRKHLEIYRAVLGNPALSDGVRLTLTMVLGEFEQTWGAVANRDAEPGGEVTTDLVDPDVGSSIQGTGEPDAARKVS